MNNAWKQGAPNVAFRGVTQTQFQAKIDEGAAKDQEIADLETQISIKKEERNDIYQGLNALSVEVREGVEGDVNFGKNHPLYEGMGFTTDDNRKSGLTRKTKKSSSGNNS